MTYSTSEVDTLNFGNFLRNFNGGADGNNLSATSSWNASDMMGSTGSFINRNIRWILLAVVVYLVVLVNSERRQVKQSSSTSKPTVSPVASKPTLSVSVSRPSTSPASIPSVSPASIPSVSVSVSRPATSSTPSVSVSVKRNDVNQELFGEFF